MNSKTVYLVLAIVGAIVPYVFFVKHFGAAGFGLRVRDRTPCFS